MKKGRAKTSDMSEVSKTDSKQLCDNDQCNSPATHTLVWTEQMHYCLIHANQALNLAEMMGFPTPIRTFRAMRSDEMMAEEK